MLPNLVPAAASVPRRLSRPLPRSEWSVVELRLRVAARRGRGDGYSRTVLALPWHPATTSIRTCRPCRDRSCGHGPGTLGYAVDERSQGLAALPHPRALPIFLGIQP